MNNIDIRAYIISNFKEDNIEEIRNSIEESIASHDEDPLIGLGVLFELFWNNSTDEEKEKALSKFFNNVGLSKILITYWTAL